jgi:predicted RNA-binding protein with TRAM domain
MDMEYDLAANGGRATQTEFIPAALINYFGYDLGATFLARRDYQHSEWVNIIKAELDDSRPVLYGGMGVEGGHSFVCDGYDSDDFFHMNWGWGGSSDGFFELHALNPESLGTGGGSGGFNGGQDIIVGVHRPTNSDTTPILLGLATPLSTDPESLANQDESFSISVGIFNRSVVSDIEAGSAYIGVWLSEEDGTFVSYEKEPIIALPKLDISDEDPEEVTYLLYSDALLSGLPAGTYKIVAAYSTLSDPDTPLRINEMGYAGIGQQYLEVVIEADGSVTFTNITESPELSLESLKPIGYILSGEEGLFSAEITNTGVADYNSALVIKLGDQILAYEAVAIPASQTIKFDFKAFIGLEPGTYSLSVFYNEENKIQEILENGSDDVATLLGESVDVKVISDLLPKLTIESAANSVPEGGQLSVTIENTGSSFDGLIRILIYTHDDVEFVTQIDANVSIEEGETQEILFDYSTDLSVGATYYAIVYYILDDDDDGTEIDYFEFTVIEDVLGIESWSSSTTDKNLSVRYSNGTLAVNTPASERIKIYSIDGALQYSVQKTTGEAIYTISNLPNGILIVKGSSGWVKKVVK